MNIFDEGEQVTLECVLINRDKRSKFIYNSLFNNRDATLLSIVCNIAGPIKNNAHIQKFFEKQLVHLRQVLLKEGNMILEEEIWSKKTGPEAFILLNSNPVGIKKLAIQVEETAQGRLLDIDVNYYCLKEKRVKPVKRSDLSIPPRQCLLCKRNAKTCGSRRVHRVEEIQKAISDILDKGYENNIGKGE